MLADGTWRNAKIVCEAKGTSAQPIVIRAKTPGKVVFTGNSSIRLGGAHLVLQGFLFRNGFMEGGHVVSFRSDSNKEAEHCRMTDCSILEYNPSSRETNSYWVSLYGLSNRVDHCRFQGKNDGSPVVTVWVGPRPNYHVIDHNRFSTRPPLGRNGGETLRVGTSEVSLNDSRTRVEFNLFEDCSGEAEYISNKSCENIYRYNTFVECQGALVLRHGNRCTVEGNWFLGNHRPGTGGVRIIGEDHRIFNNYFYQLAGTNFESTIPFVNGIPNSKPNEYFQIKRATVAFNTLVECRQNITLGVGVGFRNRLLPPEDCVVANNIIVSTNGPLVLVQDRPLNLKWMGNFFHGAEVGMSEPGITASDPRLRASAGLLPRPDQASPALGRAEGEFDFVIEDIEGRPRPTKKDAGAIQFSNHPGKRGPLRASDVGPSW